MAMSYGYYAEETPKQIMVKKPRLLTWSYNYSTLGDKPTGNVVSPIDLRFGNPAGPVLLRLTKDNSIIIDGLVSDDETPGVNGVIRLYLTYGSASTINLLDIDLDSIAIMDYGKYKVFPVNRVVSLAPLTYNTPNSFMIEYEWISGTRCVAEWRIQFGVY